MDRKKTKRDEALERIPKAGLLRLTEERPSLAEDKRIALIRKGNELFNSGRYDLAKKVFLTAGYNDGLVRLGDRYKEDRKPLEAFRMYWIAKHAVKTGEYAEKMSLVIRQWLHE